MSDMDIYNETENLISSDEYGDDEDDLMNTAIGAQTIKGTNIGLFSTKTIIPERKNKMGEIKLLMKRKKLSSIYKKRSIKWLNNKQKRNNYKEHLMNLIKRNDIASIDSVKTEIVISSVKETKENVSETITVEDIDDSPCKEKHLSDKIKETKRNRSTSLNYLDNQKDDINIRTNENVTAKRCRSPSPVEISSDNKKNKNFESEKLNSSTFYKEINEMFPKYDEAMGQHIKSTNTTIDVIDQNVARILLDIQTLNDILHSKEIEWNKLIHLKKIKEEILTRLVRKKHIFQLHEKNNDGKNYTLGELKELELYLSTSYSSITANVPSTAQQLIENRANMRKEDLERERINTNRLQNILTSNNILPKMENDQSMPDKDILQPKNFTSSSAKSHQLLQSCQYLENSVNSSIGRQGPFKDVKSIIADFRQKNPEVHPRVGKRIKVHDTNIRNLNKQSLIPQSIGSSNNFSLEQTFDSGSATYTSTLQKLLSSSSRNDLNAKRSAQSYSQGHKLNTENQKSYYKLKSLNDELCNEVSITPISENKYLQKDNGSKSEILRSALHTNMQQNLMYLKDIEDSKFNENELQICQECKIHEARFVCAGCGNQWYCSRNCQISAWDNHSETCIE